MFVIIEINFDPDLRNGDRNVFISLSIHAF